MWIILALIILTIVLTVSITWPQLRGAPWLPSSMKMVHSMLTLADVGPDDTVYDLGCGDGRLIIAAARKYGANAVGIEIDPLRYIWCQIVITFLGLRNQVKIIFGDLFSKDLSPATVITCYLLQDTNDRLEGKLKQELNPGTRVVSNAFVFQKLMKVRQDGDAKLYLCNWGN
ncbi:MAG: class I SAM-dependent methyltransferase [Anaerolineaceae bacterium]|nr:class I SAM-dependent methyltransferase [Anaerolineaceae bacterium]